jgi:hypothetical protein
VDPRRAIITHEIQVAAILALGAFAEARVMPQPVNEDKRQVTE